MAAENPLMSSFDELRKRPKWKFKTPERGEGGGAKREPDTEQSK